MRELYNIFYISKVCSKMMTNLLTLEQEVQMNILNILGHIENKNKFFENIIICDESCFFLINTPNVSAHPCTGRAVDLYRRKHNRAQ